MLFIDYLIWSWWVSTSLSCSVGGSQKKGTLYSFSDNNPLVFTDRNGKNPVCDSSTTSCPRVEAIGSTYIEGYGASLIVSGLEEPTSSEDPAATVIDQPMPTSENEDDSSSQGAGGAGGENTSSDASYENARGAGGSPGTNVTQTELPNNDRWEQASISEKVEITATVVGTVSQVVPYAGDYVSLGCSVVSLGANPSGDNAVNLGLDVFGAILPFVAALGTLRRAKRITNIAEKIKKAAPSKTRQTVNMLDTKEGRRILTFAGEQPTPEQLKIAERYGLVHDNMFHKDFHAEPQGMWVAGEWGVTPVEGYTTVKMCNIGYCRVELPRIATEVPIEQGKIPWEFKLLRDEKSYKFLPPSK